MVKYITLNNKQLPVRISYHALSMYKKETGVDFDGKTAPKGTEDDLAIFEPIIFYSLESGHRATGEEMTIKRKGEDGKMSDEMFELLEECFMEFAGIMTEFFPNESELGKKKSAPAVGNRRQRKAGEKVK